MAATNNKMISVEIKFWTDTGPNGELTPRVCLDAGMIRVLPNSRHDIKSLPNIAFNSWGNLSAKIEEAMMTADITMTPSRKSRLENGDD